MNVVNKLTGEILDLKLLWRVPTARRGHKRRYGAKKKHDHLTMAILLLVIAVCLDLITK